MKFKTLSLLLMLACTWAACKNDAAQSDTTQSEQTPVQATPEAAGTIPGTGPDVAFQAPAPENAAAGQTATTGMKNPAHGQPGHVCGIPVGAALDGTAATPATSTPAAQPAAAPKPATAPSGVTTAAAPGTNPAHGQPGHRCDISVGAALDSKPKQ